jgi:hypothetical protein
MDAVILFISILTLVAVFFVPEVRQKLGLEPDKSSISPLGKPKFERVLRTFFDARDFSKFVGDNTGGIIFLDIQIDEDFFDGDTDSTDPYLTLFEECFSPLEKEEKPSTINCTGTSFFINTSDSSGETYFTKSRGFYRVHGYFSVVGFTGPHQGLMSCILKGVRVHSA